VTAGSNRSSILAANVEPDLKAWAERKATQSGYSTSSWLRLILLRLREREGAGDAPRAA